MTNDRNKVLVKMGGSALTHPHVMTSLCQEVMKLTSSGHQIVIVHGGGPFINQELTQRGIIWEFHRGLRITTPPMMKVIEEVLWEKVNSQLVGTLKVFGKKNEVRPQGFSGAKSSLFLCRRAEEKLGLVGEIKAVDTQQLQLQLQLQNERIIPVVAPLGVDDQGNTLNINADWAAGKLAMALKATKLIFLTDQDGILDTKGNSIPQMSLGQLEELIRKEVVTGGMLVKALSIRHALQNNVKEVFVVNGKRLGGLASFFQEDIPPEFPGTKVIQ